MEEGPPIFHPPPLGPELRIYAKRGGDSQEGRGGGALVASRVGYSVWNPANLCCTKLLSCAEKQAPDELILSLLVIISAWAASHGGTTSCCCSSLGQAPPDQRTALQHRGFLRSCLGQAQVLMFASGKLRPAQIVQVVSVKG